MQRLLKIPVIRKHLYGRAVEKFAKEQEARGIVLRNGEVVERLSALRTVLIDTPLVMEGYDAVRCLAAPLDLCEPSRLKHQGSWMVLTAAVSLACEDSAPLVNLAREMNFEPERMIGQYPRLERIPYDAVREVETSIHRDMDGMRAYTKGGINAVLARCVKVLDGRERIMNAEDWQKILAATAEMEGEGLHVLAFATKWLKEPGEYEEDMVFLGAVGMGDLPHLDAPWAMEALRGAAIRPVLVSADWDIMPGAVMASGVLRSGAGIMKADEMDTLDDDALAEATEHADAFLGMDRQRRKRLARAIRRDGAVATLAEAPESGNMALMFNGGAEPDVVFEEGGVRALVRLLGECRALTEAYRMEK